MVAVSQSVSHKPKHIILSAKQAIRTADRRQHTTGTFRNGSNRIIKTTRKEGVQHFTLFQITNSTRPIIVQSWDGLMRVGHCGIRSCQGGGRWVEGGPGPLPLLAPGGRGWGEEGTCPWAGRSPPSARQAKREKKRKKKKRKEPPNCRDSRINHMFRNTFPMRDNSIIPLSLGDQE